MLVYNQNDIVIEKLFCDIGFIFNNDTVGLIFLLFSENDRERSGVDVLWRRLLMGLDGLISADTFAWVRRVSGTDVDTCAVAHFQMQMGRVVQVGRAYGSNRFAKVDEFTKGAVVLVQVGVH